MLFVRVDSVSLVNWLPSSFMTQSIPSDYPTSAPLQPESEPRGLKARAELKELSIEDRTIEDRTCFPTIRSVLPLYE